MILEHIQSVICLKSNRQPSANRYSFLGCSRRRQRNISTYNIRMERFLCYTWMWQMKKS